jgi:hypothetical protein
MDVNLRPELVLALGSTLLTGHVVLADRDLTYFPCSVLAIELVFLPVSREKRSF